jgi:hypothetical protein
MSSPLWPASRESRFLNRSAVPYKNESTQLNSGTTVPKFSPKSVDIAFYPRRWGVQGTPQKKPNIFFHFRVCHGKLIP